MRVPVLTYHSNNIAGNDYTGNDHVAFAADLRLIDDLGLRIVPLQRVVDRLLGRHADDLHHCVALTCDDGTDFDHVDIDHPTDGLQRSLFNCLRDFRNAARRRGPAGPAPDQLRDFRSRRARTDGQGVHGRTWLDERGVVARSRLFGPDGDREPQLGPQPSVPADARVRSAWSAATSSRSRPKRRPNSRLRKRRTTCRRASAAGRVCSATRSAISANTYTETGCRRAAHRSASTLPSATARPPVTESGDRWNLPRYICGWHWKTPDELRAILEA
jgi:hypothetical protein